MPDTPHTAHRRRPAPLLTAQQRDTLAAALPVLHHQCRWSVDKIANETGWDPRTVRRFLREQTTTPVRGAMASGLRLTVKQRRELARRYENGATVNTLAAEYDCTWMRMWDTLIAAGVTPRAKRGTGLGRYTGTDRVLLRANVVILSHEGATPQTIAERCEIAATTVTNLLDEAGYPRRGAQQAQRQALDVAQHAPCDTSP
ncbi:hypothetical protein [Actinocatenispora rupis]|uniref:Homeodomain-like domain-containing protein n=1 Tax=Actinocatenispora rupis TaxID=519421 RepID=A0A8J3JAR8_9ACTN|nr:hypothetical protein [Actinocatenispora rupis]GID14911.1 hypothetical protein Aru02nite_58000 [Actinocatenispora rupis]